MRPTTLDYDLFDELEADPHSARGALDDEASPGCSDPRCASCRGDAREDEDGPVRVDADRERALVMEQIRAGVRDDVELTNHVFFLRHPELPRRRLVPGQDALMREWKAIRRDVVRPALDGALEPTARDGRARRILLVGDSHTHGAFGAELERLLETTGASVTRAAKIGSAVKYWLPRLPALLRDHSPDVVIVALGANMRDYPSASGTSAHVRSAVRLIQKLQPGASIVWIGPPRQRDDTDATLQRFNDILKAGLVGARFVDSASHAPRYEGRDGVHYDARAAKQWARGVFSELSGPSHELEDLLDDDREYDREDETDPQLVSEVSWGFDPRWTPLVFGHYAGGNRDRGKLANVVFDAQGHAPPGHVITKAERDLARKWMEARDNIVDPAINRLLNPTSTGATGAVISPLATVSRFGLRANGGKRRHPIHGVLVHTTGSGPAVMANTGKSKWAGACSTPLDCALAIYSKNDGFPHYVIDYQGLIVAVCSEDHIAWHAGVGDAARAWLTQHGPPAWWTKQWSAVARSPFDLPPSSRSPNQQYIGVELLGNEDDGSFTDAQYRSLAALIVDLEQRHGLALSQPPSRTLLGHEDVNPAPYKGGKIGGRSLDDLSAGWDPGASRGRFSWAKLWSLIRAGAPATRPAPPAPTPPPTPAPAPSGTTTPPTDPDAYRKFRLTYYYVIAQSDRPTGSIAIPFYDKNGNKIAEGSPGFFAGAALEGTGKLTDGRLINVASTWIKVNPDIYAPVLDYHNKHLPGKPEGYSGIQVVGGRVTKAMTFHEIEPSKLGIGYGVLRKIPLTPFRTLAADIGAMKKSEPRYKGKGGLVPPGTRVFIKEFVGVKLPDGTVHDGWFVVNDTGGAINGVHFDVFAGTRKLAAAVKIPSTAHVWFSGIESRIPKDYKYGLHG